MSDQKIPEPPDCLAVPEFVRKYAADQASADQMHEDLKKIVRWWEWLGASKTEALSKGDVA